MVCYRFKDIGIFVVPYDMIRNLVLQNIMQRKMLGVIYYSSVFSQLNYLSAVMYFIGTGVNDQLRLYRQNHQKQ